MAPACRGKPFRRSVATFAAALIGVAAALAPLSVNATTAELKRWNEGAVPSFVLPATIGPDVKLDAQRGRIVLVHFFATWCEPCREELPALRRLVERADPNTIVVLAISVAEVDLRVRRFLETTAVNFQVLLDRDRSVAKAWKVSTLPSTIVLDSNLKPKLVVEADFAWDLIEPKALMEMLGAIRAPNAEKPNTKGG